MKSTLWIGLSVFALIALLSCHSPEASFDAQKRLSNAQQRTAYSPKWPMSQADYLEVKRLVEKQLEDLEIIYDVYIKSSYEADFYTLGCYTKPWCHSGRIFRVTKHNQWFAIPDTLWDSWGPEPLE